VTHPLLERLRSGDPQQRKAACRAAARDPAGALLVEPLVDALGDPVRAVGRAASDAVVAIADRAGELHALLRRALRSEDPRRRWGAAFTLARLEPPGPKLLPALVGALADAEGNVRWAAARLLVETGRRHPEVLPLLLGLAGSDPRPPVRRMAAFALAELAPDLPEAARVLLAATRDDDPVVRRAAFAALAALLDPPPEVGKRLLEALTSDPDTSIRRIAALALGELAASSPPALAEAMTEALHRLRREAGDPGLRQVADQALDQLEAAATG
jgi:HEAT repeat protein